MNHYDQLILKSLINQGGSSSETYAYTILTGDFNENTPSLSRMWDYLDAEARERIVAALTHCCSVDFDSGNELEAIASYMGEKQGLRKFHSDHTEDEIERMTDDEYFDGRAEFVVRYRKMLEGTK